MGFGAGASRAERKAKRRKLENSIPDIPDDNDIESIDDSAVSSKRKRALEDDANEDQAIPLDHNEDLAKNKESNRKSKKTKTSAETPSQPARIRESSHVTETEPAPKKSKKERKAERKAREAAENTISTNQEAEAAARGNDQDTKAPGSSDQTTAEKKRVKSKKQGGASDANTESKASRFIVFIGNLPFTATTASIKNHFAAVKPASVRHLTEKGNPTKSRGCAFLEFEGYDYMKTCLKQFHQSTFNDGISAPRKVNVELTAGGGGNTKDRRSKIKGKNEKLNEQRVRQAQVADNPKPSKNEAVDGVQHVLAEDSGVHPSRKARIGG
ncbi:307b0a56-3876-49b9-a6fa-28a4b3a4c887 [Sclerotinia trifoliorum]|uniref:307b0a56-3876-49b9-a6fa-28a4b3a4c887 n=1 Tax=Sclerotinia trifoliorum TaxID=28548 RepID=A0A8H2W179_9HELO|nr:307b0a56-3876-49b9-a6fa-28a4b3a4c887 [Sclerotinia trifoliorum]